jgi:hypothetical protein
VNAFTSPVRSAIDTPSSVAISRRVVSMRMGPPPKAGCTGRYGRRILRATIRGAAKPPTPYQRGPMPRKAFRPAPGGRTTRPGDDGPVLGATAHAVGRK